MPDSFESESDVKSAFAQRPDGGRPCAEIMTQFGLTGFNQEQLRGVLSGIYDWLRQSVHSSLSSDAESFELLNLKLALVKCCSESVRKTWLVN